MSSPATSAEIRSQLSHPVVDADGHWLKPVPIFLDYLRDSGGAAAVDRFLSFRDESRESWYRKSSEDRRRTRHTRPPWWIHPAATLDRATAMMPALLAERLEEFGIDLSVIYPSLGLTGPTIPDPDLRRAFIRAFNTMTRDLFSGHVDRFVPVAVIPAHTPEEALDELDFVVQQLGMKAAVLASAVRRPSGVRAGESTSTPQHAYFVDNLALDSEFDYDQVWKRFTELGVAVTAHSGSMSWPDRSSPTNFVFNHIGHFAQANHAFARALFLGGVTRRFPELNFAFLEGGVGWACNLCADLRGHWEKRARGPMLSHLQPTNLDLAELRRLLLTYGGDVFASRADEILASTELFSAEGSLSALTERESNLDDFSAAEITEESDLQDLFAERFYFGCEADDPTTAWAFDGKIGAVLKPLFSSDLSHFDVIDMRDVVAEAWELVEHDLITEDDFRRFTFSNIVALHGRMNDGFFAGTSVEEAATDQLRQLI